MSDGAEQGNPAASGGPQEQGGGLKPIRLPDGRIAPPVETRFKPGQSGNPGGKPKGASVLAAMLRELARDPDEDGIGKQARELAQALLDVSTGKRAPSDIDTKAALAILDRTDGPVEKKIEHSGELTTKRVVLDRGPDAAP